MATVNPYLNFPGTAEAAFQFYQSVLGGEFQALQRFRDTPEANKLPETDRDKIMHIALPIGDNVVLMATDALESMGQKLQPGNNYYIAIDTDTREEADRLFNSLSEGGIIELPIQQTFWGSYFGICSDKFGIQWMINFEEQQNSKQ